MKLVAAFAFFYSVFHLALYFSNTALAKIFDEVLAASPVIIPVCAAMSFVMFTYVDNMSKDLTDVRNDVNKEKYKNAQTLIASVKKEVLMNAALMVGLFVLERAARALGIYFIAPFNDVNTWLQATILVSLRMACFAIAVWAAICQLRGFIITVEFRTLIATNRK